jgi:hypothetical protein
MHDTELREVAVANDCANRLWRSLPGAYVGLPFGSHAAISGPRDSQVTLWRSLLGCPYDRCKLGPREINRHGRSQ